MYLCSACADNLSEVRKVTLRKLLLVRRLCEECGKMKPCNEYEVRKA